MTQCEGAAVGRAVIRHASAVVSAGSQPPRFSPPATEDFPMTTDARLDSQEQRLASARSLKNESDAAMNRADMTMKRLAALSANGSDTYPITKLALLREAAEFTAQARTLWQAAMDALTSTGGFVR